MQSQVVAGRVALVADFTKELLGCTLLLSSVGRVSGRVVLVQLRDVREERTTQLTRDVAGRDLQERSGPYDV